MIPSELLDEWIADPKKITPEIGRMLAEGYKRMQVNTTQIFVFPAQFFEWADNKIGTPEDTEITPEKFRHWLTEESLTGDVRVAFGKAKVFAQPVTNPPTATPAKVEPPPKAITVQDVINAFDFQYGEKMWSEWSRAGLGAISDRYAPFTMYELLPKEIRSILNV